MATKATEYIVADLLEANAGRLLMACYLGWLTEAGEWGWAKGGRAGAARFTGRDAAFAAADRWEAAIRAAGHEPRSIVVLPARGGLPCTRPRIRTGA